jgi:hypothetical protein
MRGRKPVGEAPLSSKERSRRWRERKKANKEAHEQYLASERERWAGRKAQKKTPVVANMTRRELKAKRKSWRESKSRGKKRNEMIENLVNVTPPATPPNQPPPHGNIDIANQVRSRNRISQHRIREMKKLRKQLETEKRKVSTLRVSVCRLKRKLTATYENNNESTPRKTVRRLLGDATSSSVFKQLTYKEVLLQSTEKALRQKKIKWRDILKNAPLTKYRGMRKWLKDSYKLNAAEALREKTKRGKKNLSKPVLKKVEAFWLRPDVSEFTSGKKQTITRNGIKMQRRYMKDTGKNLLRKYNESTHFRVSYASFMRLKPFHILQRSIHQRETCGCQKCSNLFYMARSLKNRGVLKSDNIVELSKNYYCMDANDRISESCVDKKCSTCPKKLPIDENTIGMDAEIKWHQWVSTKIDLNTRTDGTGPSYKSRVTTKIERQGTVIELAEQLEEEFSIRGARHIATYMHQQSVLWELKSKLKENEAIVNMDFAENWVCKYHSEVQSVHFGASHEQCTIHDGVIYTKSEEYSFATLSNSPRHDPVAIWTYLKPVLSWLLTDRNIESLHFWTDGPVTQYRSKKNFYLFSTVLKQWFPQLRENTWNFSGAGHGKNAADGVGGAIKRSADALVAMGTDIPNAQTLFNKLSEKGGKIQLFYTPAREIADADNDINIPVNLTMAAGTMRIHQLGSRESSKIWFRNFGCFCAADSGVARCDCYDVSTHSFNIEEKEPENRIENTRKTSDESAFNKSTDNSGSGDRSNLKIDGIDLPNLVDRWVIVIYEFDGRPYPGLVTSYDAEEDEIYVSVMRQKGENTFNWPEQEDIVPYGLESVRCVINEPTKHRRHFRLAVPDWIKYQSFL